jgi:hypothetical protein
MADLFRHLWLLYLCIQKYRQKQYLIMLAIQFCNILNQTACLLQTFYPTRIYDLLVGLTANLNMFAILYFSIFELHQFRNLYENKFMLCLSRCEKYVLLVFIPCEVGFIVAIIEPYLMPSSVNLIFSILWNTTSGILINTISLYLIQLVLFNVKNQSRATKQLKRLSSGTYSDWLSVSFVLV